MKFTTIVAIVSIAAAANAAPAGSEAPATSAAPAVPVASAASDDFAASASLAVSDALAALAVSAASATPAASDAPAAPVAYDATPTGDSFDPLKPFEDIFQAIDQLKSDIHSIVQDVESVIPLLSGDTSSPQDFQKFVIAIPELAAHAAILVAHIASDLKGIVGLNN